MIAQIDKEYVKIRPLKLWNRMISYGLFEGRPVTTRGRWVNPILFRNFKFLQRLPQLKKVEKPIFIIGTGRSGTTLLGKILSIHSDISFLNEPKALWHSIYDKEDIIGSYSKGQANYLLHGNNVEENHVKAANKLYGAYLAFSGGSRVLDKYPELIFRISFVKKIFPDSLFLLLIRNGKDTIQSINNWSDNHTQNLNKDIHNWWGVNGRKWKLLCDELLPESELLHNYSNQISVLNDHMDRAAVEWIVSMEQGLKMVEKFPASILTVKYEDLIQNNKTILEQILNFAFLDTDHKLFQYANEVIDRPSAKRDINVQPFLQEPFDLMMKKLGYTQV